MSSDAKLLDATVRPKALFLVIFTVIALLGHWLVTSTLASSMGSVGKDSLAVNTYVVFGAFYFRFYPGVVFPTQGQFRSRIYIAFIVAAFLPHYSPVLRYVSAIGGASLMTLIVCNY